MSNSTTTPASTTITTAVATAKVKNEILSRLTRDSPDPLAPLTLPELAALGSFLVGAPDASAGEVAAKS